MRPSSMRSSTSLDLARAADLLAARRRTSHRIPNSRSVDSQALARSSSGSGPRRCAAARARSGSATSPSGNSGKSRTSRRACRRSLGRAPTAAAVLRPAACAREQQVVEDRRRQPRLEQPAVEALQHQVAAVGVLAPQPTARRRARRSPRACGWSSRTSWRAAPRRGRARRRSRRGARARASSPGAKAWTSTKRSSAGRRRRSTVAAAGGAGAARRSRGATAARARRRRAWARARGGRRSARARRRTGPCRPGRSTRSNSANARARSGMWCSTAWPSTRSKLSSANGSGSASAGAVSTSRPSRSALARSVASMPGEMSVQVASRDHAGVQQVELK